VSTDTWTVDALVAKARAKEGLDDFGPGAFEEPLAVLVEAYAGARLNDVGAMILGSGVVHSLRMRLRAQEWFRRHPEIATEPVDDPVVVVGMMRSGTTLTQRLLAADPAFQCVLGWEVLQVAPPLDHDFSTTDPRIAAGLAREEQTRTYLPELFAIHPMHALEAEEEIVFLADAFLSHVPESGADVPAYRSWLDEQELGPAYDHLHRMLQLLQWQKRQRGEPVRRWVLKTPAHLGYLDVLRARFPRMQLVQLHRDPRASIASGASLNTVLHRLHSDDVDPRRIGRDWLERMAWTSHRAEATRATWAGIHRLAVDLEFELVVRDPLVEMGRVYDVLGLPLTDEAERSMRDWLARRPREAGRPAYDLAEFGLTPDEVVARCQY
jgi:hypothetical protein